MNNYIEIPEEWADQKDGYLLPPNMFMSAITKDGKRVISINACKEFPELFEELKATGWHPEPIELTDDDFIPPNEY